MTQHPQVHLDVPAAPPGCSAQVLLLLPPALFPDPSLVTSSAPGFSSARSLSAPGVPNAFGWDHYELEKAVGWSKGEVKNTKRRPALDGDDQGGFESRSQLTEAERARIRLVEQSKRGKFREVTRQLESGQEFRVLASNDEEEEVVEQQRQKDRVAAAEKGRSGSASPSRHVYSGDAGPELAQEYRALLLGLDRPHEEHRLTLQLHARYLSARPSESDESLLTAILGPASSGTYSEIRYPNPRILWRCNGQGARQALDKGAMEASPSSLLPSQWSQFQLPIRSSSNPGRLLFPPSSLHSTWRTLQLPQPTTAHMDQVVRYTQLATLLAAATLLLLTSSAAKKVSSAYGRAMGKIKKE